MLRIFAVIAFIVAIIFFVVALIVNATTNPTSVQHYVDVGLIGVAAGLGFLALDGAELPRRTPRA